MQIKQIDSYQRELVSETTLRIMCDIASGDFSRPVDTTNVDWEELFQALGRNGLLAMAHDYLTKGASKNDFSAEFCKSIEDVHRTSAVRLIMMYMKVTRLLNNLAESSIDYMVLKGPALAQLIYPDPTVRGFNDLDLIIRARDWPQMHQYLLDLGFIPEYNYPQHPPKLIPTAVLYEAKYWHEEDKFLVEVHYDDLLNAGLASRGIEGFWQRAIQVEVDNIPVKTLCLEDQLIHLCMHAHYHGYTRLNWFTDIGMLIQQYGNQLNWSQVLETTRLEEAEIGLYYSLLYLEKLLNIKVPSHVTPALKPNRFRQWCHEYYMPQDKILSLQPMFRPDFSFYFIPLFKRLLPDLLVMGRHREKCYYLLRLFCPPQDWLRFHYKLETDSFIYLHYILHPLKVLVHYLAEIFHLIRTGEIEDWTKKDKVSH